MYKYFHNCHTAEDVKHQYRENAKKYHPDLGGNPEDFKAMRIEYERLWEQYKNIHRTLSLKRNNKKVCPKFCVNSKSQCKIEQKLLFWGVSPLSTL